MAYSEDFRKRVNEYLDEGHTWAETQKTFKISLTAISSWRKKYQETGDVKDAPPRRKAFRKLDPDKLRSYLEEHPDAYLKEIGAAFGCSDTAVLKAFRRLKITRKKRPNAIITDVPSDQIAYVDETGMDSCLYREYGGSERGKPLMGNVSGRKFRRTGIVAAQRGKSIIAPLQYDGTMDSALFEAWFKTRLLPDLPEHTVILMDNASFHRKSTLSLLAEHAGFRLVFLPPYSPEFNPIEHFWAWLKRHLRKILPLHSSFDLALHSAFQRC